VDISAYLDELDLAQTGDTAETSTFGVSAKTYIAGLRDATLSLSGNYDPTATTGVVAVLEANMSGGTPQTMVYKPGGTATGQNSFTFSGLVTGYNVPASVQDKVTISGEVQVTGAVTVAQI
jgi:hypothetical protein